MPDEHITEQPQPLPPADAHAVTVGRVGPARPADACVEVPDIALPGARKQHSRRPVQVALAFLLLASTFMSCGLGVQASNRFNYYFILACFGAFAIALGISVVISVVRAVEYSRLAAAMRRRRQFERAIADSDSLAPDLKSRA